MYTHDEKIMRIYGELESMGKHSTLVHSKNVCKKALELCEIPKLRHKAELSCALHDISIIIPKDKWIQTCFSKGIEIIEEEKKIPLLLHQKLSAAIANKEFGIADRDVLSAIACHTTLKPNASYLDLLVFVSDKIALDGQGDPPWLGAVNSGLSASLQLAAYRYMAYMIENNLLLVLHPDFLEAYNWLKNKAVP